MEPRSQPALAPLACSQCAGSIPFGDDATTECPFCHAINEVPTAYREMRTSKLAAATTRAEAETVLARLDRPAARVTKIAARMLDLPMLLFFVGFGIPVGLIAIGLGLRFEYWLAARSGDPVPPWMMFSATFSALFVMIFVPRVLGIHANRRATGRMRLLAALEARPPTTPGGPSSCRRCGAPLHVGDDALLAVCAYCGAEHAVHVKTHVIDAVRGAARQLATTLHEAAEADRGERRQTRRMLVRELIRYVWPTAVFGAALAVADVPDVGPVVASLAGLFLIGLVIYSLARKRTADERERAAGNDTSHGWVLLGVALVWAAFLSLGRLVF
jgi:hypothetical protein